MPGYRNIPVPDDLWEELNRYRKGGESWAKAFRRWLEAGRIFRE